MHIVEFKKSQVTGIDYYPYFLQAVKEMYGFCKKYKIPFNFKSKDIQKFFYHYCLEKLCDGYQKCKTKYPKAFVIYSLPKEFSYNQKFFEKALKVLPVPWVKVKAFDSPDVEFALIRALAQTNPKTKNLNNFCKHYSLYSLYKKHKKIKNFSFGSVDLTRVQD